MRFKSINALIVWGGLLCGCTATSTTVSPSQTAMSSNADVLPVETDAATEEAGNTPSSEQADSFIQIAQDTDIANVSWSPDGDWIAFWVSSGRNVNQMIPGFYEVGSDETCYYENLEGTTLPSFSPSYTYWAPDNQVVIVSNGQPLTGVPCDTFTPVEGEVPSRFWTDSPDGNYRALLIDRTYDNELDVTQPQELTAVIVDTQNGNTVSTTEWTGSILGNPVPQWIGNNAILLRNMDERGPLLVTVEGEIISIIPHYFNIPPLDIPETAEVSGTSGSKGMYHFILNSHAPNAPLLLYHPETDSLEELPFTDTWGITTGNAFMPGFSPDGNWLLVQNPIDDPDDYTTDWIRPVDGESGEAFVIAYSGGAFHGSKKGSLVAFNEYLSISTSRDVIIMSFPDGEKTQTLSVLQYELSPVEWSPSGDALLVMGWNETQERALFLAHITK